MNMAPKADDRDGCTLVGGAGEETLHHADTRKGQHSWVSSPYAWMSSATHSSWKIGCVLKVDDAPSYAREKAITTGYRHPLCYAGCLRSIFWLHNETVNIWTHFLGFVYFLYLLYSNLFTPQPHIRGTSDLVAVSIQLLTYQVCMLFSSLFHTFLCHSESVKVSWQEADHAGILLALWGTYARLIVTKFSCFPLSLTFHLVCISLIFALVFFNKFKPLLLPKSHSSEPEINATRESGVQLYLFLALSLYAVAPFAHWISVSSALVQTNVNVEMIKWMFFPYGVGGLGLFFYLSRVPECLVPHGKVDLWGASHQIWHLLIFAGMVSWYELTCWLSTTRPMSCELRLDHALHNNTMSHLAFIYS
eukprot:TRINITY_DN37320_c1_g1_i1.p1 TRINITY_DN37320_c1_g1~~TRINITY_DN37320_c1_g1_i1.p1  ORF type:complete len:362 (+),score=74.28 TRINITY_DN37320_c1_g1_i1:168-1253(+)